MSIFLKIILAPFMLLYQSITSIRNRLYDSGKWHSATFNLPVINVGNLNVGGSGKTPHIEYIIALLRSQYKIATLSRGYGRKTKGFLIASERSSDTEIGDEPAQIKDKFPDIIVSVGEDRLLAIPQLLRQHPDTDVILLDDAYQHRSVRPGLNILLTTFDKPFYEDHVLPLGRLRESPQGYKRADIIIVTKCPAQLSSTEMEFFRRQINPLPHQQIFFTRIDYSPAIDALTKDPAHLIPTHPYLVVTGIAQASYFHQYLAQLGLMYDKLAYRDHYNYNAADVNVMIKKARSLHSEKPTIVTTEKDFIRLKKYTEIFMDSNIRIIVIPIKMTFIEEEASFNQRLHDFIRDFDPDASHN